MTVRHVFLCTAPSANNSAIPMSRVWINNLAGGLKGLGSEIVLPSFDTHRFMQECAGRVDGVDSAAARARYGEQLAANIRQAHDRHGLDLFLAYVWSAHITPTLLDRLRTWGIPTVLFFCNAAHQFHLVEEIAPHFDYCLVPEEQALPKYRAVDANPVRIQMAADPQMYQPHPLPRRHDVTFVGQQYLNRRDYVAYLAWHQIDIQVWGPGWRQATPEATPLPRRLRRRLGDVKRSLQHRLGLEPAWYPLPLERLGGILSDEEMIQMPSLSHISLNFSEVQDEISGEIKRHIRLRDFEVPMSGGLLLTGYQEELSEFYEIDREIICYDSPEELRDKCRYYLAHPAAAERIRQAGYQRARTEHTWSNRFRQFFEQAQL